MLLQRILAMVLAVAVIIAAVQLVRFMRTSASSEAAAASLHAVRQQIGAIESLADQAPDWTRRTQAPLGQGGLAAAVNDCLAGAGLPQTTLVSLSPSADSPVAIGSGSAGVNLIANRRRAVMTLAPITLPQTGKLLNAWRQARPDWVITSIDLAPEPPGRREPEPGSDLPLRAVITIETLFVQSASAAGDRR